MTNNSCSRFLPLVYVVILSWNHCRETLSCISSVKALKYPNKRILLVDNGSQDGTPQMVASLFPDVDILINEKNIGFAAGCNRGFRYALGRGADFIFLLNNDVVVEPHSLEHLVKLAGPDVGMVAPKIYYAENRRCIWSIGGLCHPLTLEKTGDARGQIDNGQFDQILERDYLTGCAVLISRNLLEKIGLFDERFFMYYEDSDLSLRARQNGFRLLLAPDARAWHKVAVSSGGSDSPNERYWMARSSVLFFHKHIRGLRWLIIIPYRLGSAIKTLLRLVLNNRWRAACAYLYGLRDGLLEIWLGKHHAYFDAGLQRDQ